MNAREYVKLFGLRCTFFDFDVAHGTDLRCDGTPVVAVYVSDDERKQARFICRKHAEEAERSGDGPVFWLHADDPLWSRETGQVGHAG